MINGVNSQTEINTSEEDEDRNMNEIEANMIIIENVLEVHHCEEIENEKMDPKPKGNNYHLVQMQGKEVTIIHESSAREEGGNPKQCHSI